MKLHSAINNLRIVNIKSHDIKLDTVKKDYSRAITIQKEISGKIITCDTIDKIENICGIDVSYKDNIAYCSAVITNITFQLIATANLKCKVEYPYLPGLFFLRESGPLLETLALLKNESESDFDILLIDGHGVLHPRRCGLASYVGYTIDKPTIGIAKKLICGSLLADHFIEYRDNVLGYRIKKEGKKPIYVSVGHKISLRKSIQIVQDLTKNGERIPEPLRIADVNSKNYHNFAWTNIILQDIDIEPPDVYIIDYRLPGHKNGIDIAIEILNRFPSASILFITAFELLHTEISKNPIFYGKNTQVLVKPVKLDKIEKSMLDLVNKN